MRGVPPLIELDKSIYKFVDHLDVLTLHGVPSLISCKRLSIKGRIVFARDISFTGEVTLINLSEETKELPSGNYVDQRVEL